MNNKKVKKYLSLTNRIKLLEKQREELRRGFIATNGGESSDFIVVIQRTIREGVAGKTVFVDRFGEHWLKENNLLTLSEVNTVVVKDKSESLKVGVA